MPMKNIIEHNSNYSGTTKSLWSHSKDETTKFNADLASTNNFKSFKYKAKLLETILADAANGILRNGTISIPLKYLTNFWRLKCH